MIEEDAKGDTTIRSAKTTAALARLAALAGLLGVSACSVTATPIHGRDGAPYQYISCGGLIHSLTDCYAMADKVCPNGYRVSDYAAPIDLSTTNLIVSCQ